MKISDTKAFKEKDGKREFTLVALLRSRQVKVAKNSSEFLIVEFGDISGTLQAMCFSGAPSFNLLKDAPIGSAFEISGVADFFNGRPSPKIETASMLSDDEMKEAMPNLVPTSKFDPNEMRQELEGYIEQISSPELRATVRYVLEENTLFWTSTAAVKMHHAFMYGLLEHSLKMTRMAISLLPLYPFIDRDLSIAGCILHDIGKTIEYTQDIVSDRTRAGILQGHVVLGYRIVRKAGLKNGLSKDILERLEHIILSHQGEPEWGAAVRAATPEAVFVSTIDNFDAKMGAVETAIESAGDSEFAEVAALHVKLLTTPPEYPKQDS